MRGLVEFYRRHRVLIIITLVLVLISPLFGVIGAELVNYHEPLDIAAEKLGLGELELNWTPFVDYTVPGLPDVIGYIVCGLIGVGVILLIGFLLSRLRRR